MSKAFALIELMVVVSMVLMISTGGIVFFNKFNTNQKLDKTKSELVSMFRLAQNYAKVKQTPSGYLGTDIKYVKLLKNGSGDMEVSLNGTTQYFSKKLSESGATFSIVPSTLYYWAGTGQLSSDVLGNFYNSNQKATVTVTNTGNGNTKTILIDYMGRVE